MPLHGSQNLQTTKWLYKYPAFDENIRTSWCMLWITSAWLLLAKREYILGKNLYCVLFKEEGHAKLGLVPPHSSSSSGSWGPDNDLDTEVQGFPEKHHISNLLMHVYCIWTEILIASYMCIFSKYFHLYVCMDVCVCVCVCVSVCLCVCVSVCVCIYHQYMCNPQIQRAAA